MIWTLELSWVAEHRDLFTVGYPASERIMMALYQLAETGRPVPQQVSADEPTTSGSASRARKRGCSLTAGRARSAWSASSVAGR